MLIIKRKAKEMITIEPVRGSNTNTTVQELFTSGAIEITLLEVCKNQVKLAISAPTDLQIWRGKAPNEGGLRLDQELPLDVVTTIL
jgi:sRNA-binding carbon storage regulator CsrA